MVKTIVSGGQILLKAISSVNYSSHTLLRNMHQSRYQIIHIKLITMEKTDYIPHSLIAKVIHYPASIAIVTKSDGLYSTKGYVVGGNGIYGEFEKMPD